MRNTKELQTILTAIYCLNKVCGNENEHITKLVDYAFNRLLNANTNMLIVACMAGSKEVKTWVQTWLKEDTKFYEFVEAKKWKK